MRSHYSAEIDEKLVKKKVTICGWVHKRRDHGGIIFLDIRDRTGLVQIVYEPEKKTIFEIANKIRNEYVIKAEGTVRLRPKGQENNNLISGKIEIVGEKIIIINSSKTIPFQLDDYHKTSEEIRLKYRYIDLRNFDNQSRIIQRSYISKFIRNYLDEYKFLDIETPFLTKSTLEGAKDYLVPSKNHYDKFYALPQSPQLFKQLLMIAGFDRYYQIVKCFRDEDLRSDRQPEFTQIDIEASFINQNMIMKITENMIKKLFKKLINVNLPSKFPIITYKEAINKYGSDKPDLRIPLYFVDIKHILKNEKIMVSTQITKPKELKIIAMRLKNGINLLTRKMLDDYQKFINEYKKSKLLYMKIKDIKKGKEGIQSSMIKNISNFALSKIIEATKAQNNDIIFFNFGQEDDVNNSMSQFRTKIGKELKIINKDWAPLWIIDFPMFKKEGKKLKSFHHPFTAPKDNSLEKIIKNPEISLSHAYDMVINGHEVGSGSIRINKEKMQKTVFKLLNISKNEVKEKFNFLLEALKYGAPTHGGIAFGLDRLTMIITNTNNIRDVIAFPKTQTGNCLMTKAPSEISTQ